MFVTYLVKRDKKDAEMINSFNRTINVHLKDTNKSTEKLTKQIQEFSDTNREYKEALAKIYDWNRQLVKERKADNAIS